MIENHQWKNFRAQNIEITVACKSDVIHVKPQHIDTVKQLQIIESVYLVLLKQQNIWNPEILFSPLACFSCQLIVVFLKDQLSV